MLLVSVVVYAGATPESDSDYYPASFTLASSYKSGSTYYARKLSDITASWATPKKGVGDGKIKSDKSNEHTSWVEWSGYALVNYYLRLASSGGTEISTVSYSSSTTSTGLSAFGDHDDGSYTIYYGSGYEFYSGTSGVNGSPTVTTKYYGNSDAVAVVIDSNPPSTPSISPGADTKWHTSSVTYTISSSDSGSGIAKWQYSTDGNNWADCNSSHAFALSSTCSFWYRVVDNLGNESKIGPNSFYYDSSTPTVTLSANYGSWNKTAVTVTATVKAGSSGLAGLYYKDGDNAWGERTDSTTHTITTEGATTVYCYAANNAGTSGPAADITVGIDRTAPKTPDLTSSAENAWSSEAVIVTASSSDSGSGIKNYSFSTDNTNWTSQTSNQYTVQNEGISTVYCKVTDNANPDGNTSPVASLTVNIDYTAPTKPVLTPSVSGWSSEAVTVTASSSESGSGIKKYSFSTDATTWTEQASSNYTIQKEGVTTVYCKVTDNAGNTSDTTSLSVKIDYTAPTKPVLTSSANGWSAGQVVITASSTDSGSEVKEYLFSIDAVNWTSQASNRYTISNEGVTTVYCKAADNAGITGNISDPASILVEIDYAAPVITNLQANLSADNKDLVVSWVASDEGSGIAQCGISYSDSGMVVPVDSAFVQSVATSASLPNSTISKANYTATLPLSSFPVFYGATAQFRIIASDSAANETAQDSATSVSVEVPPSIRFSVSVEPYGTGSTKSEQVGQDYMEVDLSFGVPASKLAMLSGLCVTRSLSSAMANPVILPDLTIDPSSIPATIGQSTVSSPAAGPWKEDSAGNIVYVDYVPVESGAGNKSWTYALAAYRADGSTWPAITDPTQGIVLPNNKSTVALSPDCILDMNGTVSSSPSFSIGASGAVQLLLQGSDSDRDTIHVKVYRVKQTVQSGYAFTGYTLLSGTSEIVYDYPYSRIMIPLTLGYGDNNLEIVWTEGSDATVFHSSIIDLALTQSFGKYLLTVLNSYGNQVDSSAAGIICAPHQPLLLSVGAADASSADSTVWNFGDGQSGNGASITHMYSQLADQAQSSCAYTMRVTFPDSTHVDIPITVQDTQQGTLWGSETWRGPHTVIGTVLVPSGVELHIATTNAAPTEVVSFSGDEASGYQQGITINAGGTLRVDGGVSFKSIDGQAAGWDTIFVGGNAYIGSLSGSSVTIENADRGIAVDETGQASLANITFTNNTTGLHVYGAASSVSLNSCTFTGNTVYGIKEDDGGRPSVRNTRFLDNFRNYYQWDGGIISIDALNALNAPGNYGNKGE